MEQGPASNNGGLVEDITSCQYLHCECLQMPQPQLVVFDGVGRDVVLAAKVQQQAIIWSAYLLVDTTAIYALGHMSVNSSKWLPEHQLMAFWAPFLLLHLGGQDNITAYSIEDNRLWLRHL